MMGLRDISQLPLRYVSTDTPKPQATFGGGEISHYLYLKTFEFYTELNHNMMYGTEENQRYS